MYSPSLRLRPFFPDTTELYGRPRRIGSVVGDVLAVFHHVQRQGVAVVMEHGRNRRLTGGQPRIDTLLFLLVLVVVLRIGRFRRAVRPCNDRTVADEP